MVFELYGFTAPRTAENFRLLCTGERGRSRRSGRALSYVGTRVHAVVAGVFVRAGDTSDAGDGGGGECALDADDDARLARTPTSPALVDERAGVFAPETFKLRHDARGTLSMATHDGGVHASQFFVVAAPTASGAARAFDGKHTVFGRLVDGDATLAAIERHSSSLAVDGWHTPTATIEIVAAGELGLPVDE